LFSFSIVSSAFGGPSPGRRLPWSSSGAVLVPVPAHQPIIARLPEDVEHDGAGHPREEPPVSMLVELARRCDRAGAARPPEPPSRGAPVPLEHGEKADVLGGQQPPVISPHGLPVVPQAEDHP